MIDLDSEPTADLPHYWDPSSVNRLLSCSRQFSYAADPNFSWLRTSNTFASLGIAAHELTKMVWRGFFKSVSDESLKSTLESEWLRLVVEQHQVLSKQWPGRKVPQPQDWPYFALTQAKTVRRLRTDIKNHNEKSGVGSSQADKPLVERELSDDSIRLKGVPDRVVFVENGFYVFDIKTGHSIGSIEGPYRRQLLLYAHLVAKTTGKRPLKIAIVKAGGETLWEDIDDSHVARCVEEVTVEVGNFVSGDRTGAASPSPSVCRFCEFKVVCRGFWEDSRHEWADLRGVVGEVTSRVDAATFQVRQKFPIEGSGRIVAVSNVPDNTPVGNLVAIVDGYLKDGVLRGSWYTKCVPVQGN